jgi:hypothetical protein
MIRNRGRTMVKVRVSDRIRGIRLGFRVRVRFRVKLRLRVKS